MALRIPWLRWLLPALLAAGSAAFAAQDELRNPPAQLVRKAVDNEVSSNAGSGPRFMFKDERTVKHFSQTKLLVETRETTAGLLIAQDGHPLTPQQQHEETVRLENYIRNPDELNKKRKQEKEEADRIERILKALPDALIFEPDGTVPGSESVGHTGELVRFKFRPNPNYEPPSRVEQVLTGMAGHVLIDPKRQRVAEIDGTLEKEVGFGWGILGHLDRGGRFLVQQADIGDGQWEITHMELTFTGRILLFKKLNIQSSDMFSGFRRVPSDLTFAQGVELLEKEAARPGVVTNSQAQPEMKPVKPGKDQPKAQAERQLCCDR